jgi:hypothetical protein
MAKVILVLARGPGQPEGDIGHRLTLQACLTPEGRLDAAAHAVDPLPWHAVREEPDRPPRDEELVRLADGWALRRTNSADDAIWMLSGDIFRPGDYATLKSPRGEELMFRIVAVNQD